MGRVRDVEAVLDPVLTPLGFAAGQDGGSGGDDSGDIIWCASFGAVLERFPWLPQLMDQGELTGYECFDLRVTLIRGRIAEVDLEGDGLVETLRLCGRPDDAPAGAAVLDRPAADAAPALAAVLTRLFAPEDASPASGT